MIARRGLAAMMIGAAALGACGAPASPPASSRGSTIAETGGSARASLALMQAAADNNANGIRAAIEVGADANAIDTISGNRRAMTPLTAAAAAQALAAIEALLDNGANVNARDGDGQTPLLEATLPSQPKTFSAEQTRAKIVARLLDKGADPNATNKQGATPLMQAALHGPVEVVEALIAKGAQVNPDKSPLQGPPLVWATDARRASQDDAQMEARIVAMLLDNGASIEARSGLARAHTPLFAAVFHDKPDVAKLLIARGADVNNTVEDDQTPLMAAAANSNAALVELLIGKGANVNAKSARGQTALDVTSSADVAEMLRRAGAK